MVVEAKEQPSLRPGQMLGGCRIVRWIGSGGMGEVYLAQQVELERQVAVKILPRRLRFGELVERFLKEARLCSRIEHPNVVAVHHVGEQAGLHYMVMQYVEGQNLAQLLRERGGPFPWADAVMLIRLAAKGLAAVHGEGLIHRDIKPSNIMLSTAGRVFLMDFGLVRQESGSDLTETGSVLGTAEFMSPEQCRGETLDQRTDIYSLGRTLFHLVTGQSPHLGTDQERFLKTASNQPGRLACDVQPGVPRELSLLLAKAMSPLRQDRYGTIDEVIQALGPLLPRRPQQSERETPAARVRPTTPAQVFPPPVGVNPGLVPLTPNPAPARPLPVPSEPGAEPLPEFRPDDTLPLPISETIGDSSWPSRRGWIVGAVTAVVLLLVALAVNLLTREDTKAPSFDTTGMVQIPAGNVVLGNTPERIRQHIGPHTNPADPTETDRLIEFVANQPLDPRPVAAFWIDKYEVTNAQYAAFLKATSRAPPPHWTGPEPPVGQEDHPVINVTYEEAEAYATWAGKKLPTAEQWVRAFRGDGDELFPWGDSYDKNRANVIDRNQVAATTPVAATPQDVSRFGVFNLVGNAREFLRGQSNFQGRVCRVAKGSSYASTGYFYGFAPLQVYLSLQERDVSMGFRCVAEIPAR
jgi:serine/threonine-protein kinase